MKSAIASSPDWPRFATAHLDSYSPSGTLNTLVKQVFLYSDVTPKNEFFSKLLSACAIRKKEWEVLYKSGYPSCPSWNMRSLVKLCKTFSGDNALIKSLLLEESSL